MISVAEEDWWNDWYTIAGQTCVAAYQAIGAPSQADSYTDLTGNGKDLQAFGTAPGWSSSNGWEFSGSQALEIATGTINPDEDYSVLVRFSNLTANQGQAAFLGVFSGDRWAWFPSDAIGRIAVYRGSDSYFNYTDPSSGVQGIVGLDFYRDKNNIDTSADTAYTTIYDMAIGGARTTSTIAYKISAYIQAIAFYSTTLSSSDVSDLTDAMNNLS
jgi:hypothetical protein